MAVVVNVVVVVDVCVDVGRVDGDVIRKERCDCVGRGRARRGHGPLSELFADVFFTDVLSVALLVVFPIGR